ncbi:D-glycerate dehydrogenase [Seleniivibrio sp.]|uniref:2-hydroxyacid dehydrogenase n=1 Tax=Seleniivibrio sp. TaxID=2898801 RepID=UPI0025D45906|nr:D-glycerate dehydrogenase [Seleniivibrio sp.]MCD8553739.1 D-glycerate dehydrogenase [Seleniivibrio sp.]
MKILVTAKLPYDVKKHLAGHEVDYNDTENGLTPAELAERAKGADAIISMLSDKITPELIDGCPKLKAVANYAVGFNNIDVAYAKSKGITVCNTPDVLTQATAELGFSLMMAAGRRIVESDKFTREGRFHGWKSDMMLGVDFFGKTIGVFGFGRIGQAVAKMSIGFGMKVLYNARTKKDVSFAAEYADFGELVSKSDFVIITAPATPETKHKFTMETFKKMKSTAVLVNIGRGEIIKESDLADALEQKLIFAAGLDVYEFEPKIEQRLFALDNVILAPHIGSGTTDTRSAMGALCCDSILTVFGGGTPRNAL